MGTVIYFLIPVLPVLWSYQVGLQIANMKTSFTAWISLSLFFTIICTMQGEWNLMLHDLKFYHVRLPDFSSFQLGI